MKMKYAVLIVIFFAAFFHNGRAQTFTKFQIGYATQFARSPQYLTFSNNTYSVHSFSMGSGMRVEAGVIQALRKNVSIQLDVAYLSGKNNALAGSNNGYNFSSDYHSKFFDIAPLIRLSSDESKLKPYLAFGPVVGFGKFYIDASTYSSAAGYQFSSSREYKESYALGTKTEAGARLDQGNISYYVQLTVMNLRYSPTNSELKSEFLNSVNQMPFLSVSQKKTIYDDNLTVGGQQDPNQPSHSLKSSYPFESVSLNVGVMFKF